MQQLRPAALAYLAVVTAGALAALSAATVQLVGDDEHLRVLLVLSPIFVLAVYLKSSMTQQVSLSANVPILIAAYLIGGWSVACLVGVSAIVLDRRKPLSRVLFNNAQWVLMGLAGGLIYDTMGGELDADVASRRLLAGVAPSHHRVDCRRDRCQRRTHVGHLGPAGADPAQHNLAQHGCRVGRSLLRLRAAGPADGRAVVDRRRLRRSPRPASAPRRPPGVEPVRRAT